MNITIIAIGSRGDIVPYIALSQGLIQAGHTVCLATHLAFEKLVRAYDIPFFALDDEPKEIFQTEGGEKLLAQGTNPYRFAQQIAHRMAESTPLYIQRSQEACREADTVIVAFTSLLIGHAIAERDQKKLVVTMLQPMLLSTAALPEPTSPWLPQRPLLLGKAMNQLSHILARQYTGLLFLPAANAARKNAWTCSTLRMAQRMIGSFPRCKLLCIMGALGQQQPASRQASQQLLFPPSPINGSGETGSPALELDHDQSVASNSPQKGWLRDSMRPSTIKR